MIQWAAVTTTFLEISAPPQRQICLPFSIVVQIITNGENGFSRSSPPKIGLIAEYSMLGLMYRRQIRLKIE